MLVDFFCLFSRLGSPKDKRWTLEVKARARQTAQKMGRPQQRPMYTEIVNDNEKEKNDVKSQAGHNGVKRTGNNLSNQNMEKRSRQVKHKNALANSESEEEEEVFSLNKSEMDKNNSSQEDIQEESFLKQDFC